MFECLNVGGEECIVEYDGALLFQRSRASEEVSEHRSRCTRNPTVEGDLPYLIITTNTTFIDNHHAF